MECCEYYFDWQLGETGLVWVLSHQHPHVSMIAIQLDWLCAPIVSHYLDGVRSTKVLDIGRLRPIASAQLFVALLVTSGILFLSCGYLRILMLYLIFYTRQDPRSHRSAAKKFIVARLGDACCWPRAPLLLYNQFPGTGPIWRYFLRHLKNCNCNRVKTWRVHSNSQHCLASSQHLLKLHTNFPLQRRCADRSNVETPYACPPHCPIAGSPHAGPNIQY